MLPRSRQRTGQESEILYSPRHGCSDFRSKRLGHDAGSSGTTYSTLVGELFPVTPSLVTSSPISIYESIILLDITNWKDLAAG